jgi:hypothetical protein
MIILCVGPWVIPYTSDHANDDIHVSHIHILLYCDSGLLWDRSISPRPKIQQTLISWRGNKETQSEENIQKIQLW